MTNLEYLTKKENIKELAKNLISIRIEEDIDYDWDEEPYVAGYNGYLVCSDGYEVWYFNENDLDEAIEHEIEWLLKERKNNES